VQRVIATESVALGALAVAVGAATALAASAGLVVWLFELPYHPPWGDLVLLTLATFALSAGLGGWGGHPASRRSPLADLRAAELP